ncbi:MAG: hypothetical protein JRD04_00165 [Deltaproteobacteria bacterium]|nr:hypothetical protein [Deltaproteobacteria bacterium]
MTGRYSFPCALLFLMFVGGCSTYSQLDKDLEQYQPPVYATPPPPEGREQTEASNKAGFALEKKKISETKALWERALQTPRKKTSFFIPPLPVF